MESKLIYRNGNNGINVIDGNFVGYKNLVYNNIMDVAFKPEGSGRIICKSDDFVLLKLKSEVSEEFKEEREQEGRIDVRIKIEDTVYEKVVDELAGSENLEKSKSLDGLFLTFKDCLTYEIDLEKLLFIVVVDDYNYIFNYNYINTIIERKNLNRVIEKSKENYDIKNSKKTSKTKRFRND